MKLPPRSPAVPHEPLSRRLTAAALAAVLALLGAVPPSMAQPAAPAKVRNGREQQVTLNFVNAEIDAISRAMAAILERQIVVDPRVKGTMTLYSEQPLTRREAYLNYLAALRGLGYTVVQVAGLMKVVPEAEAKLQTGAVSVDKVSRSGDQILTQIFRLQHENANNLVTVLRPLISPNNTINANPGNNSLVITDYADNLQRIAKMIAALDIPSSTEVEVVPLQFGVAADMVPLVQRFADASAAAAGAAGAGTVTVAADSRTNSLLIRAPNAARLASVREVIEKLDRETGGNGAMGNIYVVYLKNADAVKLAAVLRAAYSAAGGGSGNTGLGASGGTTSTTTATTASSGGTASNGASPQSTAPVQASASPSTGGFIQADPATNSLIITAPEPVYRQLRAVIDQLDTRRAQVYVESMIVKMDAQQAAEFGFQWQTLLGKSGDSYGVALGTNFSTTNTNSGSTNIINLATATTSNPVLPATGLNVGLIKAINGVYTLGALARFLESNTSANVLSTPNLVALDNEEAKIVIGQNVPFVTGSFTNTGTSTSTVSPFQTVERKDVGLTLRVKPQVGENGTVRMTIYQENSSVVANTTSSNNGPTTDKSAIETTVVVDDGQIMVLGGLLKDEFGDGEDRVPGLASIPLIGNLFKSQARKRVKTNLLVFLRPVVMRTQAQADALTMDRYDAIRAMQINAMPKPSSVMGINESPLLPDVRRPVIDPNTGAPVVPAGQGWGKPATEPAPDH